MENTNNRTCGYVGCTPAFKSGKTTAIEDRTACLYETMVEGS